MAKSSTAKKRSADAASRSAQVPGAGCVGIWFDQGELLPALPRARDTAFGMIFGGPRYGNSLAGDYFEVVETPVFGRTWLQGYPQVGFHLRRCSLDVGALDPFRHSGHVFVPEHSVQKHHEALDDLLVLVLDDAIQSARRTGAAMDRLAGTLTELHAWAAEKLEAVPGKAGA